MLLRLCVASLVLAACVAPIAGPDQDTMLDGVALLAAALPNHENHDDPSAHPAYGWRMEEVFSTNLPMDRRALSPPSEFSIHENYAFVSTFHPSGGLVILDIEDPENPRQVSFFDVGTAYINDAEVSPDGRWAFLPTSPITTAENNPLAGGLVAAGDYGIQVVDLQDMASPTLATFAASADPDAMGYHRLDLMEIDGALYVATAPLGFPKVEIYRFDPSPPLLRLVSTWISPDVQLGRNLASSPNGYGIHDITFGPDPLDGTPLIGVSHWRAGAQFLDASDPTAPRYLGKWDDFDGVEQGNVHNVEFTEVAGRRIAVVVPEYPKDPNIRGTHWIVDITDFLAPDLLGQWTIPGSHPPKHVGYSSNRVEIRDGFFYSAHFHAGVIVVDMSTEERLRDPRMVAFVIPEGETIVPYSNVAANPYIYDAIPYGGHVLYTDLTGGFHVARMD